MFKIFGKRFGFGKDKVMGVNKDNISGKEAYDIWLSKYLDQGKSPTFFDNLKTDDNFILVKGNFDTGDRRGADSIKIISLDGSKIKVGGHCEGYVIQKDGVAVVMPDYEWVPIFADFKYVGEDPCFDSALAPISKESVDEIINGCSLEKIQFVNLVRDNYDGFIMSVCPGYAYCSELARESIMYADDLYNKYLEFLAANFDSKLVDSMYRIRDYIDKENLHRHDFVEDFFKNGCLSSKEKENILFVLSKIAK